MKNKGLATEFERNDQDSKLQHLPDSTTQLHSELPRGYNETGLNRIGELLKRILWILTLECASTITSVYQDPED